MIDLLSGVPLFAGLNRAELAPLAALTVARSYPRNLIVVNEGDRAETLYFVLSGRIKVFVASDDGHLYCLAASDGKLLWSYKRTPEYDDVACARLR